MPLFGYREGSPQDVAAINRLGSTFSDALLGLQANRIAQQRWLAQQAFESQRIEMERARARQEALLAPLERERLKADTARLMAGAEAQQANTKDIQQQISAGQNLGFDLSQYAELQKNAEMHPELVNAITAQIAKQQGAIASASPGTIGREVPRIMESAVNPDVRRLIATDTPSMMSVPRGAVAYDVLGRRPAFSNPYTITTNPEQTDANLFKALTYGLNQVGGRYGDLNTNLTDTIRRIIPGVLQKLQGDTGTTNEVQQSDTGGEDAFGSEDEARSAGKKTGDKVRLKGIGLVRLH